MPLGIKYPRIKHPRIKYPRNKYPRIKYLRVKWNGKIVFETNFFGLKCDSLKIPDDNDFDSDPTWKIPEKSSIKLESPQQKKQKFYKCVVPFCQSEGSTGFYKFPLDVAKNATWVKYCGLTRDSTLDDRVCYLHFNTSSFGNSISSKNKQQRLKSNAIPELNVPNVPVPLLDDHDQEDEDYDMSEEQARPFEYLDH